MVGHLGRYGIWLSIALFILSALLWWRGKSSEANRFATASFLGGTLGLVTAFVALGVLFLNNQFQYDYVKGRSEVNLAVYYKISCIWSGQQGSFLLWAVTSAIWGVLASRATGPYRRGFQGVYALFLASLASILAFESPFSITSAHGKILVPPNGEGMTPALQNVWNVIHPPIIFTGFGSLTVAFCWAIAVMLRRGDGDWVARSRPWVIASTTILGLGLCLGGFWAYETLGWGGFWAWDPVENSSFVPWIFSVALVHGLIMQAVKKKGEAANLMLAAAPFLTFLYGTYLTRSGIYNDVSVHSFATMDRTAIKILIGIGGASVFGFLFLWIRRVSELKSLAGDAEIALEAPKEAGTNRSKLYNAGILMLACVGGGTAIGMSVPLIMFLGGNKPKAVEEHTYHMVLVYFLLPLLFLMTVAPFSGWKAVKWGDLLKKISGPASLAFGITGATVYAMTSPDFGIKASWSDKIEFPFGLQVPAVAWAGIMLYFCYIMGLANLSLAWTMSKRSKAGLGGFVAHVGVAFVLTGLILSRGFERKAELFVSRDARGEGLGYVVSVKGFTNPENIENRENKVLFDLQGPDGKFEARPGLYYVGMKPTLWPHIQRNPFHDIYFSLAAPLVNVLEKPVSVPDGKTVEQESVKVTNLGLSTEGPLGQIGAKFKVKLRFEIQEETGVPAAVYEAEPSLKIGKQGLEPSLEPVGTKYFCNLEGIDAGTKAATVSLMFRSPIFPIQMFYKPMTILVYLGTGILTLGGLMALFYRRYKPQLNSSAAEAVEQYEEEPLNHAPLPTTES